MTVTYTYPAATDLMTIAPIKAARLIADRVAFKLFPMRSYNRHKVQWDQKDVSKGLQGARGLNGKPTRVQRLGFSRFEMQPAAYGDYIPISEKDMTERAAMATFGQRADVTDLVLEDQDYLMQRMLDRIELNIWSSLGGTLSVYGPNGALVHTDSWTVRSFVAAVAWTTFATATPLADLRAMKLYRRGYSVDFGRRATLYVNQATANSILQNQNSNDLYGRRTSGLATVNNLDDLNRLLAGDDLPQIAVYDQDYYDEAGNVQLFIPDHVGYLVGARPADQEVGEYQMTTNASNPGGAPGMYSKVIDHSGDQVPPLIETHMGHNGGPAFFYPSAVIKVTGI